jgi:hypothetical protein
VSRVLATRQMNFWPLSVSLMRRIWLLSVSRISSIFPSVSLSADIAFSFCFTTSVL